MNKECDHAIGEVEDIGTVSADELVDYYTIDTVIAFTVGAVLPKGYRDSIGQNYTRYSNCPYCGYFLNWLLVKQYVKDRMLAKHGDKVDFEAIET